MKLTVTNLESGKEKTVNVSASNLGKLSVKKNPHLHGKEHMKKLNKKRWAKKLALKSLLFAIIGVLVPVTVTFVNRGHIIEVYNPITLPEKQVGSPRAESGDVRAEVSAYTSDPLETDSDPYTMASGKRVYDGAIANNCLKFGSKVEIQGKQYTVEDRMNRRYGCDHYDVWMSEKSLAYEWGRRNVEVKIIK